MKLTLDIQCTADDVAQAVCKACDITHHQLLYAPKSISMNFARGLFCAVCIMCGIHPTQAADVIKRSRANVITVAKHYMGYLETNDATIRELYEKIISNLLSKH